MEGTDLTRVPVPLSPSAPFPLCSSSADRTHCRLDHLFRRPAAVAQRADAGRAIRLAQFLIPRFHDQRMVQELRRLLAAEQPRELDLSPCRGEEVVATD